jgi:DNA-binding XRE family transcriptional regulator
MNTKEILPCTECITGNARGTDASAVRRAAREFDGMETKESQTSPINRVRELRENRLMTQAQLARKAKVALRTIHSVEKGMNCRMDTKRKILLALGMRFEDKDYVFPSSHGRSHIEHTEEPTTH